MSATLSLDATLAPQVERAAGGDVDAFRHLVETTSPAVCGIAFAIARNLPASEDIAQDVFLSVWKGLGKLKNPHSFLPWLRQLTRNQANSWLRRRYSERAHQQVGEAILETVSDPRRAVDASLEERENLRLVAETLEYLPDEAREVLVLFYREGRSTEQVAQLLGLSPSAVRKRLQRARQNLRQDVARRIGRSLEKTAPGTSLITLIVATASATGAPAGAAVSAVVATPSVTTGVLKIGPWAALAGTLAGVLSGIAGVVLGARGASAEAIDEAERQQLRRLRYSAIATVVAAGLGFVWSARFSHWLPPTAIYLAYIAGLYSMCFVWLPRIISRRLAYQLRTDPDAATRQRRQRNYGIAGFVGGALGGGIGLFAGLWASGLLP